MEIKPELTQIQPTGRNDDLALIPLSNLKASAGPHAVVF